MTIMTTLRLFTSIAILFAGNGLASDGDTPKQQKALLAVPSEYRYLGSIMGSAEGDWNGDGVPDLVMLLTGQKDEGAREERLFVFTGKKDGSYQVLSMSNEFCHPNKFYNLSASSNGASFEVEAVGGADATYFEGSALKFRYNLNQKDFELIGREDRSTNYDEDSSYRVSVNYLSGVVIQVRHLGKTYVKRRYTRDGTEEITQHSRRSGKHKEAQSKFDTKPLIRLKDFECSSYYDADPAATLPIRIDENFKVQKN